MPVMPPADLNADDSGGSGVIFVPADVLVAPPEGGNNGGGDSGGIDGNVTPGTEIIVKDEPGDLGSRLLTVNAKQLLRKALRTVASDLVLTPYNHRYRGHRESVKYNLMLQQSCLTHAQILTTVDSKDTILKEEELNAYPLADDIANMYHILEQIRFKEWLLLKDSRNKWYF